MINFGFEIFCDLGQPRKYHENVIHMAQDNVEDYERAWCIHDFHVYCDIWEVAIREIMSVFFCLVPAAYTFLIDCTVVSQTLFSCFLKKNLAAAAKPC